MFTYYYYVAVARGTTTIRRDESQSLPSLGFIHIITAARERITARVSLRPILSQQAYGPSYIGMYNTGFREGIGRALLPMPPLLIKIDRRAPEQFPSGL